MSSLGIETIVCFAGAKGVSSLSEEGGGKESWSGACRMDGSQSSQLRILVARSVTGSEIHPNSLGRGLPPNVRRRAISRIQTPLTKTCVRDLTAVLWLRCNTACLVGS